MSKNKFYKLCSLVFVMALSLVLIQCGGDSETSKGSGSGVGAGTGTGTGTATGAGTGTGTGTGTATGTGTSGGKGQTASGACANKGEVKSCKVFSGSAISIKKDVSSKVFVAAFDSKGARNNCAEFSYASGDKDVADVKDGAIVGGKKAGETKVTVKSGASSCGDVTVTNLGDPKNFRVTVLDALTRAPLDAATVEVGGKNGKTAKNGSVDLDVSGKNTVKVFAAGYNYVALMGIDTSKTKDLAVYLKKNEDNSVSGGIKGKYKFLHALGDPLGDDEVAANMGIGGSAIGGSLFNLSLASLLGDMVPTKLLNNDVSLPSGLTLETNIVQGIAIDEFKIINNNSLPTFWAFGGSMSTTEVSKIFQQVTGGGSLEIGSLLVQILPVLGRFNHGITTASSVFTKNSKLDKKGAKCASKTGKDCVSDFSKFSKKDIAFTHKMGQKSAITIPALPAAGAKQLNTVIVLTAWDVPKIGFVPSGISAALTEETSPGSGKYKNSLAKPIDLNYSLSHSGLNGSRFGTMAVTTDLSGFGGDGGGDTLLSGLVSFSKDSKGIGSSLSFASDFLGFGVGSKVDLKTKKATVKAVKGANIYRIRFDLSDGSSYEIWSEKEFDGDIPAIAKGVNFDWSKVDEVFIQTASTTKTFEELVTFNSSSMDDLNYFIKAFNTMDCNEKSKNCALTK